MILTALYLFSVAFCLVSYFKKGRSEDDTVDALLTICFIPALNVIAWLVLTVVELPQPGMPDYGYGRKKMKDNIASALSQKKAVEVLEAKIEKEKEELSKVKAMAKTDIEWILK